MEDAEFEEDVQIVGNDVTHNVKSRISFRVHIIFMNNVFFS
jgi:hypothetical protein